MVGEKIERMETTFISKAGQRVRVSGSSNVYLENGVIQFTRSVFHDITLQKKTETEINDARIAAEKANLAKTQFLSNMSHELLTPLNAILGFSNILRKDEVQDNETQMNYLSYIEGAGSHLLAMINDILDLATIESGKITYQLAALSLYETLENVHEILTPLAEKRNIKVHLIKNTLGVKADYLRLKQVILNLGSNAVKYHKEAEKISIEAWPIDGNKIRLEVSDNGNGIPEGQEHNLFQPFNRLSANAGIEGTGIGLSISKKIIEDMTAQIGYYKNEDGGATFWVELPSAIPVAVNVSDQGLEEVALADFTENISVLVVEDEMTNIFLMKAYFKKQDFFDVDYAATGAETIEKVKQKKYQVIVQDINLPDMHG